MDTHSSQPACAATDSQIDAVLSFWFGPDPSDSEALAPFRARWFSASRALDREIVERFRGTLEAAARGELDDWAASARGRLALIVLFDQFSRNIHRGTGQAFAYDQRALELSIAGIAMGLDLKLSAVERVFFYMPFQHAETLAVQVRSVELFESLAREHADLHMRNLAQSCAEYARQHHAIIAEFGRFPHRNRLLERASTRDETMFLRDGGPTFGQ